MGAGHGPSAGLYLHRHSPLHRLAPQCKLAATFLFVLAVVAAPREAFWAYGLFVALLITVARIGRIPALYILRRLVIETPFVAFAFFMPIVGRGERVDVLGLSLSQAGLWAAWNILIKGTLGVTATILMASSTSISEILHGLERLRLPKMLVGICAFMIRYIDVISGEMQRMRVARESRGHNPRWIWQVKAVAASAGALFIRSYERGERVYLAMASRGYNGAMPVLDDHRATRAQWSVALLLPITAASISSLAWIVR
ncbi:MAG: cobalt ECF transporter T component CbiQ [Acidimicrobiia bacterium]